MILFERPTVFGFPPSSQLFDGDYFYVYRLFHRGEVVYIGFTKNIRGRLGSHLQRDWSFDTLDYIIFEDEEQARRVEIALITVYSPTYNTVSKGRNFISQEMVDFLGLNKSELAHLDIIEFRKPDPERIAKIMAIIGDDL